MLARLSIRDFVLIDRLDIDLEPGLCALTGETGAGKSILLDALGLTVGGRADAAFVRPGADQAIVAAAFEPDDDHQVWSVIREQGIEAEAPLVLRRVIGADGRSRAFVNDQPASVGLLRRIGEILVEIQGHAEHNRLMNVSSHRPLVDAFGGHAAMLADTRAAHRTWRDAVDAVTAARLAEADARAEEDNIRHAKTEIDQLGPEPGEEATLAATRATLVHAEKLIEAMNTAHGELTTPRAADEALQAARRALERAADKAGGRFDAPIAALARAAEAADEAQIALQSLGVEIDLNPARLQEVDDRLYALRAAARKHGTDVDGLIALRERLAAALDALDAGGGQLAELIREADQFGAAYVKTAGRLTAARVKAGRALDSAVAKELAPLKLDKARFRTVIEALDEDSWGIEGVERVWFEAATNPGMAPGPLARIASSGELSRFTLALRVVLSRTAANPTLVFDEVDSGIGGAVAAAVGERLAGLAERMQVLVVTHSPQVAARAGVHWRISKKEGKKATLTSVTVLGESERREEIARMLAGAKITDAARAAADSLMSGRQT